jgi:hypothetical protein
MFSQFFVLSLRGDTILHKDCKLAIMTNLVRRDLDNVNQNANNCTQEMFLSHVGIQNSFVEDNEMLTVPFFVSGGIITFM